MTEQARPSKILDVHFKSDGTDGVSLMMQAFRRAFAMAGIDYRTASADSRSEAGDLQVTGLSYQTAEAAGQRKIIFDGGDAEPEANQAHVEAMLQAELIKNKQPILNELKRYILENGITHVIVRNIFSLPLHLAATLALYDLILDEEMEKAGVKFVLIHHDFYWEPSRSAGYQTKFQFVGQLLASHFPPVTHNPGIV